MSDIKKDIEWVMNMAKWAEDEYPSSPSDNHVRALDAIERVESLLDSTCWIPCSERMPELGAQVFIWSTWQDLAMAYLAEDPKEWVLEDGAKWEPRHVTHWMPLPKGPEVQG